MLRILGGSRKACDGVSRRDALCVGALSMLGGLGLPQMLQARESAAARPSGPAKSVILLNLFGGPSHLDMFDPKPEAPEEIRGEFKPIDTALPGVSISELMPEIAKILDRGSLIRTYSHRYNSHNPYNVLTGFDLGVDAVNYFAKRTDHPSIASVCQYFGMGSPDVPAYVTMPSFPGFSQGLRRAGPYGGYLGSQYDPITTVWEKKLAGEGGFYKPTLQLGEPQLPSLDSLPDITADRLDTRRTLLEQLDANAAALEKHAATRSMSRLQERVFDLLTSPKTRGAFDLSGESDALRDRYGRHVWGSSLLIARRLVEAGSMFITVNWEEANSGGHWDMHSNVFGMLRSHLPVLDQMVPALVTDLDDRGLLDSTLVVVMGEMGRSPRVNKNAGRDHWPQCGFALLFGGGVRRGMVLGRSDKTAAYPIERPVSAGDMAATIYHLLGVDSERTVPDLQDRPIHIAHGGSPVTEICV